MSELDVLILRDPRESARKCSLTPLRGVPGVRFVAYRKGLELAAPGRVLLHPGGDPIGPEDHGRPLLVVDCAWRHLDELLCCVRGEPVRRALPELRTAYPRRSRLFPDPASGLASIEALYAALALLGRPRPELLAGYHWGSEFLAANPELPR
jgi:pre-rRNA-processing protein TSR3